MEGHGECGGGGGVEGDTAGTQTFRKHETGDGPRGWEEGLHVVPGGKRSEGLQNRGQDTESGVGCRLQ